MLALIPFVFWIGVATLIEFGDTLAPNQTLSGLLESLKKSIRVPTLFEFWSADLRWGFDWICLEGGTEID